MGNCPALPVVAPNRITFTVVLRNGLESQRELQKTQMVRVQVAARTKHVVLQVRDREYHSLTLMRRSLTHASDRLLHFVELLRRWLRARGRLCWHVDLVGPKLLNAGANRGVAFRRRLQHLMPRPGREPILPGEKQAIPCAGHRDIEQSEILRKGSPDSLRAESGPGRDVA